MEVLAQIADALGWIMMNLIQSSQKKFVVIL